MPPLIFVDNDSDWKRKINKSKHVFCGDIDFDIKNHHRFKADYSTTALWFRQLKSEKVCKKMSMCPLIDIIKNDSLQNIIS